MPQGTIRSFDPATRTGSLLDDGLVELSFSGRAVQASGLRELRIGQRVRFTVTGEGDAREIATLNIVSL
jgi:cold shock CspA family protein